MVTIELVGSAEMAIHATKLMIIVIHIVMHVERAVTNMHHFGAIYFLVRSFVFNRPPYLCAEIKYFHHFLADLKHSHIGYSYGQDETKKLQNVELTERSYKAVGSKVNLFIY